VSVLVNLLQFLCYYLLINCILWLQFVTCENGVVIIVLIMSNFVCRTLKSVDCILYSFSTGCFTYVVNPVKFMNYKIPQGKVY
jgi:hypothetical protein